MRRTKLVLAAVTLMVAMLVAFAAPAMANTNDRNVQNRISNNDCCERFANNNNNRNDGDCCEWSDNNGDEVVLLAVPVWGWGGWDDGWGWGGCGFDPDGPVNCWD
jgi:hypothetical protein